MKDLSITQEADLKDITVSEVFGPTVQGEGAMMGETTLFVRTGGCDYRCSWCDTMYAVDPKFKGEWSRQSANDILAKLVRLSQKKPMWVTLSGGNPALYNFAPLVAVGQAQGYRFAMETQGSIYKDWFTNLDALTLSPKGPSSGMATDWTVLKTCVESNANASLKVVVFNEDDYRFAKEIAARFRVAPLYLQVGTPQDLDESQTKDHILENLERLSDQVLQDGWMNVKVLPQMHVLTWGKKRGV